MQIENKGWLAEEYYERYLEIKKDISLVTSELNEYKNEDVVDDKKVRLLEEQLRKLTKAIVFYIKQLKSVGITSEQLLLLSIGLELDENGVLQSSKE